MSYGLKVIEAPASEPIDIGVARGHLNLASGEHDRLITDVYIPAARQRAEAATGRHLIHTKLRLTLARFPRGAVVLPRGPLASVESVTFYDSEGTQQELVEGDDFRVLADREPGELEPVAGYWPTVESGRRDAVAVEFTVGYGETAANVPAALISGVLIVLGHLFQNRQEVVTGVTVARVPDAAAAIFEQFALGDEFIDYEAGL